MFVMGAGGPRPFRSSPMANAARVAAQEAGAGGRSRVREVLVRRLDQDGSPASSAAIAAALGEAGVNIVTMYSDHDNQADPGRRRCREGTPR